MNISLLWKAIFNLSSNLRVLYATSALLQHKKNVQYSSYNKEKLHLLKVKRALQVFQGPKASLNYGCCHPCSLRVYEIQNAKLFSFLFPSLI